MTRIEPHPFADPPNPPVNSVTAPTRTPLAIDVVFDFICPWCLIGERHLASALARFASLRPDVLPTVRWRSLQLLPDTPLSGVPYQAFYLARLGSPTAVATRRAQVQRAGDAAGIRFAFDRIGVLPNTAAAHDLVAFAGAHGTAAQQAALIGRVFEAYFIEGQDIGDVAVLERLALDGGLPADRVREHLADTQRRHSPLVRDPLPAVYGRSGVPLFIFGGTEALSGAHPPQRLVDAMLHACGA